MKDILRPMVSLFHLSSPLEITAHQVRNELADQKKKVAHLQEELVRAKEKLTEAVMEAKQSEAKVRGGQILNPGGA